MKQRGAGQAKRRSAAAERDALAVENARLRGALENIEVAGCIRADSGFNECNCSCDSVKRIARAALKGTTP